jgi:hypothetical protein
MAYPAHYAWLVYTIKRHFRHLCLHLYIEVHQSQQVRHSVQGIPMVYPAHYAWLVDFDGPWCTNVNTSAWSDVWWHTLHTMPDLLTFHQSQQVKHSVQGIPSNVTSGTCVYISTPRSIKVNKSGIVCRVYHQTSLQPEVTFDGIACTLCLTCWFWWTLMY